MGAGSHHWVARDAKGTRLFVTVDDLELKPWLSSDPVGACAGLANAYEIAGALHSNGLEFVVAPIPTAGGDVLVRLTERFTVALFPFIDGVADDFAQVPQGHERRAVQLMWARLHSATPVVRKRASVRGFGVTCRDDLEAALDDIDRPWLGGPLSEDARQWVAANRAWLTRALGVFDRAAERVTAKGADLVITHGEPHGANVIRNGESRYLIDWDTVALALPERDLWMMDSGTADAFEAYEQVSGRQVDRDSISFYAMTWHLNDIALFVELLRGSHADDEDTRAGLTNLDVAVERLAPYMPR